MGVSGLAEEEWECLFVSTDVRGGAVHADALVCESSLRCISSGPGSGGDKHAYLITCVGLSSATADLWAAVQLSMTPVDCGPSNQLSVPALLDRHDLQASVELTVAGLKPAVASAGMDCDTVLEAPEVEEL